MFARLPGPALVGFAELFDRAYGDPKTPRPYATVAPSRVGKTLLPFPCPSCGARVDTAKIDKYTDEKRGFSWCPTCNQRFLLDIKNAMNLDAMPAIVTREGKKQLLTSNTIQEADALNLLGAACV